MYQEEGVGAGYAFGQLTLNDVGESQKDLLAACLSV